MESIAAGFEITSGVLFIATRILSITMSLLFGVLLSVLVVSIHQQGEGQARRKAGTVGRHNDSDFKMILKGLSGRTGNV